jgi:stearoyl-CoA desaturase (delta-9 desaturase)
MPYGRPNPEIFEERIDLLTSIPFIMVHLVALVGAILVHPTVWDIALVVGLYYLRMWAVVVGFHRYLAHRSFKTSRAGQFALALLGTLALQKGPLWWAAHHRAHHKYSDTPRDIHSVRQNGFFWAHLKWIMVGRFEPTDWERIKDLNGYPELKWLNTYYLVPPILGAVLLGLTLGTWGVVWGFLVSTTLLWHGTFCVNSLAHVWGSKRYATEDDSRNNFFIAVFTLGEGWHNNHHHYPAAARQGFYWWEIDITYYVLWGMKRVGLVWDLRPVPEAALERGREVAT